MEPGWERPEAGRGPAAPSRGRPARRAAALVPWFLLALFVLRGLSAMQADGATADEARHLAYGERALREGTFVRPDARWNSKMPVSALNAAAVATLAPSAPSDSSRRLFVARLPTLLLGVVLGWLVWSWGRELHGRRGGALALLAYTFCPNFLGHSHLVTTDVATSLGMFASVYTLWRHLSSPRPRRLALAAAAFGLAQLTKASVLLLVPILGLVLVAHAIEAARRRAGDEPGAPSFPRELARGLRRAGLVLLVLGAAAVAALNAGFLGEGTLTPLRAHSFVSPSLSAAATTPWLRDVPVPLPYPYLQGIDMVARDATAPHWSYLRGAYSRSGFRSYFLWAFLVKVPLGTQLLLGLALLAWIGRRPPRWTTSVALGAPVLVFLAYLSLAFHVGVGFRYAFPILPFLFVFAGAAGGPWPGGPRARRALAGGALLGAGWLVFSSVSIHPHYLAYFNEIAGGPRGGWRWLIDSNLDWGQDAARVRRLYGGAGRPPLLVDPSGPVTGRVAIGLTELVGRDPASSRRHAWLRRLRPVATVGHSRRVFQVTEADLRRCCRDLPRAVVIPELASDLALAARPFGGGDGVEVRFLERLNDGMLGANEPVDAARTLPPRARPVRGWFGVEWREAVAVDRVVAYPGFAASGPRPARYLASDYSFEAWLGGGWQPIPGARGAGNAALRVEHRFPPLRTTRIRLVIERQRNARGGDGGDAGFRAACLELAAFAR